MRRLMVRKKIDHSQISEKVTALKQTPAGHQNEPDPDETKQYQLGRTEIGQRENIESNGTDDL